MEENLKYQKFDVEIEKSDNELVEFWGNRLGLLDGIEDNVKQIEMARIFDNLSKHIIKNPRVDVPNDYPNDILLFHLETITFPIARRVYQTCGIFYEDFSEFIEKIVKCVTNLNKMTKNFEELRENIDIEAEFVAIVSDIITCDLLRKKNNL